MNHSTRASVLRAMNTNRRSSNPTLPAYFLGRPCQRYLDRYEKRGHRNRPTR